MASIQLKIKVNAEGEYQIIDNDTDDSLDSSNWDEEITPIRVVNVTLEIEAPEEEELSDVVVPLAEVKPVAVKVEKDQPA